MTGVIRHRGPDDEGVFSDDEVTIGNRRLAVVDLSAAGRQPMFNEAKTAAVVYNGEIYNFQDLKKDLATRGYKFFSQTDTEVVLRGYEEYGVGVFSRLRGMWAVAIYDQRQKKLILSRDFFGIKPLYYFYDGEDLTFASEIKALKVFFETKRQQFSLSPLGVQAYFVLGYTPHPLTIFNEIKKVNPGEILTFDLPTKKLSSDLIDWDREIESTVADPANFEKVMLESVEKHLIADVPVGVFLSGGADSTLIALLLKKLGKKLDAFTVRIRGRRDVDFASKIAQFAGLNHHLVALDDEAFGEMYQKTWEMLDEPIADSSLIPSLLVAREASKSVKVVMTGEGGDELFWGYERYQKLFGLIKIFAGRSSSILDYQRSESRFYLRYVRPILRRLRLLDARRRGDLLAAYLDLAVAGGDFTNRGPIAKFLADNLTAAGPEVSLIDRKFYLPDNLLYKTDFATMSYSVEGRVPILDKEVYGFARRLAPEEKWRWVVGKKIVKDYLAQNLPPELIFRKKEGFSLPLAEYLFKGHQPEIKEAIQALLDWKIDGLSPGALNRMREDADYLGLIQTKFPTVLFSILAFYKVVSKYQR